MNAAQELVEEFTRRGLRIVTVESCTGGALASAITDVSGSSAVFTHGFVTYSEEAKIALGQYLGPWGYAPMQKAIQEHTVYSPQVAVEMARVGRLLSNAQVGVGITGRLEEGQGVVDVAVSMQGRPLELPVRMTFTGEGSRREMKEEIIRQTIELVLRTI